MKFAYEKGPLSHSCKSATFQGELLSSVVPMENPWAWFGISATVKVCRASPHEFKSEYALPCPSFPTPTTVFPFAWEKALHQFGQEARLNAMTAHVGTTASSLPSIVVKLATILFHSVALTPEPDVALFTGAR